MGLIITLAYIAVGLMQIAAFIDGMNLYFHIGTILSVIIFVVSYSIPLLGAVFTAFFTYYGARYGWYWEWWQAFALAAPGIVLSIAMYSVGGILMAFQRRSA
jgi:hypothetical protein